MCIVHPRALALSIILILSPWMAHRQAVGQPTPQKGELGEPSDYARLRAKAFHDMYAGPREVIRLSNAQAHFLRLLRSATARAAPSPTPARPLPILFPDRDRNARLSLITHQASVRAFPGSSFRSMISLGAPAV